MLLKTEINSRIRMDKECCHCRDDKKHSPQGSLLSVPQRTLQALIMAILQCFQKLLAFEDRPFVNLLVGTHEK